MYLLYRFFNSVLFVLVNLTMTMYTCRRFFGLIKSHYKLQAEVARFNAIVRQSRLSLDYINSQVSEAMKEIEGDIGKELYVTHNLTKISSKVVLLLRRFNALEEGVIELVRMNHNTESVKIETPSDINTEVKKILTAAKNKERHQTPEGPKTFEKSKIFTNTFPDSKDSSQQNPVSKFSATKPTICAKPDNPEHPFSKVPRIRTRKSMGASPTIVKLLNEDRNETVAKPIGFRPSWKYDEA